MIDESKKHKVKVELQAIEAKMEGADFWTDKAGAQDMVKRYQELKDELADIESGVSGGGKYDRSDAVVTIFSGAGGDDAEDFSAMLFRMYQKYCERQGWSLTLLHENENDHGGYRNVTFEISGRTATSGPTAGRGAYGVLKNESGVHRLVRVSPFNAKQLRHTSFSLVEVIPKFAKVSESELRSEDLNIEFTRSSGPGGQNVNKRETAVRIVHLPTNLSVHISGERSQAQNKEKALSVLSAKVWKRLEEEREKREKGMYISKTTEIEWGNQIRSYVLHPYKMVKDHRTGYETSQVDKVLGGEIDEFLAAEANI